MLVMYCAHHIVVFFFNDTATTEIYTLSLHDALPILKALAAVPSIGSLALITLQPPRLRRYRSPLRRPGAGQDRKSTRLNSSHANISYAVFCLKKKNGSFVRHNYTNALSTAGVRFRPR